MDSLIDWTVERKLEFVEDYRKHQVLWRASHKDYGNRELRRKALRELGKKYSMDSKTILNKIKSLRSYFHRERSRLLLRQKKRTSNNEITSSWFAYKQMMFILDGEEKQEDDTMTHDDTTLNYEEDFGDIESSPKKNQIKLLNCGETIKLSPKKKSEKSVLGASEATNSSLKVVQHANNLVENGDRFSLFGEYVASRVRDLSSSRLQSIVQHRINTILFEAEMEMHNVEAESIQTPITIHLDSEAFSSTRNSSNAM